MKARFEINDQHENRSKDRFSRYIVMQPAIKRKKVRLMKETLLCVQEVKRGCRVISRILFLTNDPL